MNATGLRPALRVRGLRKSFGDTTVLDGIDLELAHGGILSLLGPNGAGKTTTVRILSTLISSDAGEVEVGGFDVRTDPGAVRGVIGVTGQFSAVDALLSGEENLLLMADLHHLDRATGRRRAGELLERFELADAAGKLVMNFSGGMRRKLDLAMTLMGRPRIIFLDEPTAGLDPRSRRTMWEIIRDLAGAGTAILLTTQYLEEADQLADRVAVLDRGRLVAEGTPDELKRQIPGGYVRLTFADAEALAAAAACLGNDAIDPESLMLEVPTDGTPRALTALLDRLDRHAIAAGHLTVHTADLDDVFLALTGHAHEPQEALP